MGLGRFRTFRGETETGGNLRRESIVAAVNACPGTRVVYVRPGLVDWTRQVVAELGLGVMVEGNAGILAGEIWLEAPEPTSTVIEAEENRHE